MRILQINQNYNIGSTGRIMKEINDVVCQNGGEGYMMAAYANGSADNLYVMETLPANIAVRKNIAITRLSGLTGYRAKGRTRKSLNWIESIKPEIIHLHNIHGDWIHLESLFEYIKDNNIPVVWTLHDCWAFTGRCSYFEDAQCFKWLSECSHCPDMFVYPKSYLFDFSRKMYRDKKKWFTSMKNVTIVTPSKWLGEYVKQSYLKKYDLKVINNGIDLSQFERQKEKSSYLNEEKRNVVLGVAASWTPRKGLNDFVKLYSILDPSEYLIVIVGLNSRQMESLPSGIVGIKRTNNVFELSQLYSQAKVFVNPTYQDNYPTVNLEAIACGTPVITYKTGGSVESIVNETGRIVEKGDILCLAKTIEEICHSNIIFPDTCINYAKYHFDKNDRYNEYVSLYKNILRKV